MMYLTVFGFGGVGLVVWYLLCRSEHKYKEDGDEIEDSVWEKNLYDLEGGGGTCEMWGNIGKLSPSSTQDFRRRISGNDVAHGGQSQNNFQQVGPRGNNSSYHTRPALTYPHYRDDQQEQQRRQQLQQYDVVSAQAAKNISMNTNQSITVVSPHQQAYRHRLPQPRTQLQHRVGVLGSTAALASPPRQDATFHGVDPQPVPFPPHVVSYARSHVIHRDTLEAKFSETRAEHSQQQQQPISSPHVLSPRPGHENFPIVDISVPPTAVDDHNDVVRKMDTVGGVPLPLHHKVIPPSVERAESGLRGSHPVIGLEPKHGTRLATCEELSCNISSKYETARDPSVSRVDMREKVVGFASVTIEELNLQFLLGGGAFGQVWKGQWRGTPVAVKVLTSVSQQTIPTSVMEAFEDEVTILARLRHPNICLFMAACLDGDNKAIVTELVSRGSVWDVLRNPAVFAEHRASCKATLPHWPWWAVRRVLDGTLRGLVYLHAHNPPIIHRDLKSANLLLDDSFNVKICDFGLARLRDITQIMTAKVGTVQWMAPEVLQGISYTESADIFSTGIIAWELLTGKCPFEGQNQVEVAMSVTQNHARPPLPPCCSNALAMFLTTSWNSDPLARFDALGALDCLNKSIPLK